MATSGSFTSNTGVNCNLKVIWEQTKNVSANTSTVKVSVYLVHNSLYTVSRTVNVNCMGQTATLTMPAVESATGGTVTIGTKTFTVSHNSDGSKSGTISASIPSFGVTYSGVYLASITASATVTLDTIPRASSISSVTSSVEVNGTNKVTVNINRAVSGFTHTVKFAIGSYSQSITGVATSTSYAIPMSWLNAIPSATSGTVTVTVTTYSGSTQIGDAVTSTFTITVPASVKPAISGVSVSYTSDNSIVNGWGICIKGYSKVKCNISASSQYGATIKSYAVTYDGKSVTSSGNSVTTSNVMVSVTNKVTVTVTDTRGRTATYEVTVTAEAYSEPYLSDSVCYRSNSGGTQTDSGTYLYMLATSAFSSCAGKNSATITYKVIRKSTGDTVASGTLNSGTAKSLNILSASYLYNVEIEIKDSLGNAKTYSYVIKTIAVAFNLYPSKNGGAAFGKFAEKEKTLDIDTWDLICGNIKSSGDIIAGIGTSKQVSLQTLNSNLMSVSKNVYYVSLYKLTMNSASYANSVQGFLTTIGVSSYTSDSVAAVIPLGARKPGDSTLYPAMYDGTYIRCNAVVGAVIYIYVLHY